MAIRLGLLHPVRLDVRVVGVGNLQVGGAGKTPLVAKIAQEAHLRGKKVCILSRGYQGRWEQTGGVIPPLAQRLVENRVIDPMDCGDEPALLSDLCPFAWLGVGENRIRQYEAVQAQAGSIDFVLLDDGFQYWPILQDVKLLALTSAQPWQILFREWRSQVKRADLVVWTKGNRQPEFGGVPWVKTQYQLPSVSADEPFDLVTGVQGGSWVQTLALQAGYRVQKHYCFSDHKKYDRVEVDQLLRQAQQKGHRILLTGKDWVKWKSLGILPKEVRVIEPEVVIQEGGKHWSKVLWPESSCGV